MHGSLSKKYVTLKYENFDTPIPMSQLVTFHMTPSLPITSRIWILVLNAMVSSITNHQRHQGEMWR